MRIALFGYGKMGKMIEKIAIERDHIISAKIDIDTKSIDFTSIDLAIDFSNPDAAFENIKACIEHNIPVISGTTGWLENYPEVVSLCKKNNGAFIYASNFSLGVNIFFELNRYLAKMMKGYSEYKVSMQETHHIHKLDAPSGTAITLANDIISNSSYNDWKLGSSDSNDISIESHRIGNDFGTHEVKYQSEVDEMTIIHKAHNREGFALGAVVAAEWLLGKKGVFSMKDVLNLG